MEWTNILSLRIWTPLSESGAEEVELVMDGVYKVGPHAYLRTQPYTRNFEMGDPRAPFVTMAYWSPTVDGLRRLVLGDPSFQADELLPVPPPELALGTTGLYSELIRQVPLGSTKIAERAEYSNKGVFLKRSLGIGRLNYCFMNHEDKDERAFLIEISLVK